MSGNPKLSLLPPSNPAQRAPPKPEEPQQEELGEDTQVETQVDTQEDGSAPPPPPQDPPHEEEEDAEDKARKRGRSSIGTVSEKGKPCPQCGSERHKKKPITCPFKLWTDDFPTVPRLEKEPIRDAQRRVWEQVRHFFVEGDQYVKKEGWNYLGPPGGVLAPAAPHLLPPASPAKPMIPPPPKPSAVKDSEDDDAAKNIKPCPECGVERHKKRPITCPFKLWTEDFPVVPKLDKEPTREAHQRIWGSVRQHFTDNGAYIKQEGWTFAGPPGSEVNVEGTIDPDAAPRSPSHSSSKAKKKATPRMSTASAVSGVTNTSDDGKPAKACPECGLERHKKKPITCPFKLWTNDYPVVPRAQGERTRDAHQRIWEQVRQHFVQNDQYVKQDGWSYLGPDGAGEIIDAGARPSKTPKRTRDGDESTPKRARDGEAGAPKHCPECGAERHRKKPATCAFKLWTEDFPSVPRLGREHIKDAQRRIWIMVRNQFLEDGQYVKREGWTYNGPSIQSTSE